MWILVTLLYTLERSRSAESKCYGTVNICDDTSLKERIAGQEGEEGDVSSCWMTLRSKKILEVKRGSSALFGECSLEEAMDLLQDRLLPELELK
jgi:hypothetical protein